MSSKKAYIMILICSGIICVFIFLFTGRDMGAKEVCQISCIYRGSPEEYSHSAMKQGIEEAAKDYGVTVTAQYLNNTGDSDEQIALIQKEVENKADAMIIEPVNSPDVKEKLIKIKENIPVVLANTGIDQFSGLPQISCDSYRLGKELAEKILENGRKGDKVLLAGEQSYFQDIDSQYQGILDVLDEECVTELLKLPSDILQKESVLEERLAKGDIGTVVLFNGTDLELMGKLKRNLEQIKPVHVYGTGKSNEVIADLEDGLVEGVGITNEYSVGYLSVQKAVLPKSEAKDIKISIIDQRNMYEKENQRLLFTLVQ